MDTVTYPDAAVTRELATSWVELRCDVAVANDVARRFGVHAIPTAVALRSDGEILGRIEGFVPPAAFVARAAQLRVAR